VRRGPIPWRRAEVRELAWATPHVRLIRLHVPDWPGHLAGQHVDLRLTAEDGYQAQRSYSIATGPEGDGIELAVERLPNGEVSSFLVDELRAGDTLELRGPLGGYFTWQVEQGGPLGLVAGGSGVVPLMAMARHRAARASAVPARLLCSWRTLEDVIFREELDRLGARGDGLVVTHTLTRATSELPPGVHGRRIDREMLVEALPAPEQAPLLYVCGPTPMVESVASQLVSLGHPPERVKTERFGATGGMR
jgi:ferredoxin-NADP reductase